MLKVASYYYAKGFHFGSYFHEKIENFAFLQTISRKNTKFSQNKKCENFKKKANSGGGGNYTLKITSPEKCLESRSEGVKEVYGPV